MLSLKDYPMLIKRQHNCIDCKYFTAINPMFGCCSYWEIMDRLRPCPPGRRCTVKVLKTRKDTYNRKMRYRLPKHKD